MPQSSDAQEFQVEEDVAFQSETVKNMIEDTGADFAVPLINVNGMTLSKVLEYCTKHRWETDIEICFFNKNPSFVRSFIAYLSDSLQ